VAGGERASGSPELERGYFVEPTVFTDVAPGARIAREEIFGPVVVVSRCDSEQDAIAKANDTEFGLAAGVWTENAGRGRPGHAGNPGRHRVGEHLPAAALRDAVRRLQDERLRPGTRRRLPRPVLRGQVGVGGPGQPAELRRKPS